MRVVLLATSAWLLAAASLFACSSSETTVTEEDAGSPAPSIPNDPAPAQEDDGTDDPEPTPTPTDAGADDASEPSDADVGDGNAGTLCAAGDVKETENNDTAATADPLPGIPSVYCGRLGAGDVDHASFTLNTAGFRSSFSYSSASLNITATVEGETFNLSGNGYIFKQGKVYVLRIAASGPTDYRIQLLPP
ncbi:MAG: hypothetical protein KF782_19620 [Labilithrix sp.]|nr:hypothetical protein [Labilithrix sp.]